MITVKINTFKASGKWYDELTTMIHNPNVKIWDNQAIKKELELIYSHIKEYNYTAYCEDGNALNHHLFLNQLP